jgi:hypothetical protein
MAVEKLPIVLVSRWLANAKSSTAETKFDHNQIVGRFQLDAEYQSSRLNKVAVKSRL